MCGGGFDVWWWYQLDLIWGVLSFLSRHINMLLCYVTGYIYIVSINLVDAKKDKRKKSMRVAETGKSVVIDPESFAYDLNLLNSLKANQKFRYNSDTHCFIKANQKSKEFNVI